MKQLPDNSVDSIVTDLPYGISFMSKKWDYDVPKVEVWKEAMRVLKHGGHALIACGTRTQHRMVVNIEDAGFEIRDVVSWIYGSGFPKSLNISKAIDKAAGVEFAAKPAEGVGFMNAEGKGGYNVTQNQLTRKGKSTEEAKQWDGWGTALKPACEFFTLCRKPLSEKTVAKNVLKWGTGGINVDGCRVESGGDVAKTSSSHSTQQDGWDRPWRHDEAAKAKTAAAKEEGNRKAKELGRFPANLIHDGSQEVLELFPETKPSKSGGVTSRTGNGAEYGMGTAPRTGHNDQGSAARFFYCPKASKKDRDEGLEGFEGAKVNDGRKVDADNAFQRGATIRSNTHPTVKPTALMQYLCRLITPKGGVVLDPYMGSGSTGKAAVKEGFSFVGCELDEDYYKIAQARIQR